jgi:hypothetical protein
MKKIFVLTAIFSLIFAFGGLAAAQEREKIPHPGEIKNFTGIIKNGTVLYGYRIKNATSTHATSTLVGGDRDVHGCIGSAGYLWCAAKQKCLRPFEEKCDATSTPPIAYPQKPEPARIYFQLIKPAASQCVKDAIDVKDAAFKGFNNERNQAIGNAVDARNACQKAALDKTTAIDQMNANRACISAYQKSLKDSSEALTKKNNDANKAYQASLKQCSSLQTSDATSTTGIILEDGQNASGQ